MRKAFFTTCLLANILPCTHFTTQPAWGGKDMNEIVRNKNTDVIGKKSEKAGVTRRKSEIAGVIGKKKEMVVTVKDVEDRIKLNVFFSTSEKANDDHIKRMWKSTLDALLLEKGQIEAAKEEKILITEKQIQTSLEGMAKNNSMTYKDLVKMLQEHGLSLASLKILVHAKLAWPEYIKKMASDKVKIKPDEVQKHVKNQLDSLQHERFEFSEIVFHLDSPKHEVQVVQKANEVDKVLKSENGAAKFKNMALIHSDDNSSTSGGYKGTHSAKDLDKERIEVLSKMDPGSISQPIKVREGYTILLLHDKKEAGSMVSSVPNVQLKQVIIPIPPQDQMTQDKHQEIEKLIDLLIHCEGVKALEKMAAEHSLTVNSTPETRLTSFPGELRNLIKKTPVGKCFDQPIMTPDGLAIVMVGKKESTKEAIPSEKDIKSDTENFLMNEEFNKYALREINKIPSTMRQEIYKETYEGVSKAPLPAKATSQIAASA